MYHHPYYFQANLQVPYTTVYMPSILPPRTYPPVDTKIFSESIKSFRLLMEQGSILLDRLGNHPFSHKIMSAAQQGNQAEVNRLIHSLGLKVPVKTSYTPTGVNFELTTQTNPAAPVSCCTLTINMKWGQ